MKTSPRPGRRAAVRTARAPLTRDSVVAAALALVDADGLAGLSTRKLGERLGVEAMSIYHWFPSKQHLLDALVDHAIASIPLERPGAIRKASCAGWRTTIARWRAASRACIRSSRCTG
jgi:AcrR family transcriptional regulator